MSKKEVSFRKGGVYHTHMSDGTMIRLTSCFHVESGKDYYSLWGQHVGYEDLGGESRVDPSMLVKEASWKEGFDRWLHIRLKRLDWKITKQLEQQIGNIL